MKHTTLINAWKWLITFNPVTGQVNLPGKDIDFEGFDIEHLQSLFVAGVDIKWLDVDSHDPGHCICTDEEIIANVEMGREDATPLPEY